MDRGRSGAREQRISRRSFHRGVRTQWRVNDGIQRRLCRAGCLAGKICVAAGEGRGHVPPRPVWPNRYRYDRDCTEMKSWRRAFAIAGGASALVALALAAWIYSLGSPRLGKDLEYSHAVIDREGRLLRAYATSEGRWRLPTTQKDVDPRFLKLLFAYEDKRFFAHHGVDLLSLARAAYQFVGNGHIVSGGSTMTMQVARLLEPREQRSLGAKLRQ